MERRATIALVLGMVVACSWHAPRTTAQELSALPADALTFACTQGLPALASMSPRHRVLAEGPAAADLILACSGSNGVNTLEVASVQARDWQSLAARAADLNAAGVTLLTEPARARARARRQAVGPERYDLIVLAPIDAPGEESPLSAARPRVTSETVEGLTELLAALSSDGALFGLLTGELAALRFALTAMEALRVNGVPKPSARLVVQRAGDRYGVWVSPEPIAMDTVLLLHERDQARRASGPQAPTRSERRWATLQPALVHTPVAMFTERFAVTLSRYGATAPPTEPPAYAFDVAAVRDERPLFFELTRRDRPDTWTEGGPYVRALEWLGGAIVTWLACGVLFGRAMQRARAGGRRLAVLALLLGLVHGATAGWTAQATGRALADAESGVFVALAGLAVGAALALLVVSNVRARRHAYVAGLSALGFAALAAAAFCWRDVVEALVRTDASPWPVAILSACAGAACTVPTRLSLHACAASDARARWLVPGVTCYAAALATSLAVAAVSVLFADFRALGLVAAATGVTATMLSLRCARDADARA